MTRYEQIKQMSEMSVDNMVEFFNKKELCFYDCCYECDKDCKKCLKEWLESEVE